jgi:SAM-dependent methyltransferase
VTSQLDAVAPAARLRTADGRILDLPVQRWFGPADRAERRALAHARGPALDIGCGPGRHLVALVERGVFALGIDISSEFLAAARRHGVNVLQRSVFDRVPGAGRWRTALLLDGNVGIGGDPEALLARTAELLRDDGTIIVETELDDGAPDVSLVRAEFATGAGPWFRWTTVGPDRLREIASDVGLDVVERWDDDGRSFACVAIRR